MYLHSNLKHLRKLSKRSCDVVAAAIGIGRSNLSGYENGACEPTCKRLLLLSDHYRINLDDLLRTDLTQLPVYKLEELQRHFNA